jgi:hypothetical protein
MTTAAVPVSLVAQRVRTYLRAKDEHRPHLMAQVFAPKALLEMVVKTDAIVFPSRTCGREAITDVLVRQFGRVHDNVYTFCLQRPTADQAGHTYSCRWLVGMSRKDTGELRIGCGCYDWHFQTSEPYLVEHLRITIEVMHVLPARLTEPVLTWLSHLPYPWCPGEVLAEDAPPVPAVQDVLHHALREEGRAAQPALQ